MNVVRAGSLRENRTFGAFLNSRRNDGCVLRSTRTEIFFIWNYTNRLLETVANAFEKNSFDLLVPLSV